MGEPLNIGVIGCGVISGQYLASFDRLAAVNLVAVADIAPDRAAAATDGRAGVRAATVAELLAAPDVELVVNLTVPDAHDEIALQAIAAGKSVYGEKPLASTTQRARAVLDAAEKAHIVVGCAPDTVLGTGVQTARAAIDRGLIGAPVAATATMVVPGHELWHPNPDFYYQPGGGPLLDMGPYYVSALVTLLGPVVSVIGTASRTRSTRVIGSGPRSGEAIPVSTGTHVTGVLTHASGVLSTLVMSFDAVATRSANIEVHGETGSLALPDPNRFDGEVQWRRLHGEGWETLPVSAGYRDAGRGYGVADLALTPPGAEPRAGGVLGYHVLDIMESVLDSAASDRRVPVTSTVERPRPVHLQSLGPDASGTRSG
ncbi:Gfo/Idh/MocA family oxidoreductase [Streptomyces sp. NBC_01231]|nr:Gfo/Idh/MocA family oxidoreductase [Streptomyces sp. NBC_01231]